MKYSAMFKRVLDMILSIVVLFAPTCLYGIFLLNVVKATGVQWIDTKTFLSEKAENIITYALMQVLLRFVFLMIPGGDIELGLLFIFISSMTELLYWDWRKQ